MSRAERFRRQPDPPITLSEEGGVRYLHFGSRWIQGAMRLRSPDRLELEYLQRMMAWLLFVAEPAQMLQIGIGAGALIRFCHRRLPATSVTAVELSAL
ncbi:MAG: spermidine synthase, partial [Burkholderiaceae bacterium]|nr:spermidine synthase [Burkholderiaceae bacterium]